MQVTARYQGRSKFEVTSRGHSMMSDQPLDNGGGDAGMTPPEFFLAAMATCAGHYAAQYLNTRKLPTDGLEIRVYAEKLLQPARLGAFRVEVEAPVVDERHYAGLLRAVKSCLIHNTLLSPPTINITIQTGSSAAAA